MAGTIRITDPSQLSDLTIKLASLTVDLTTEAHEVVLVLLQPLAHADMLAACRNPDSRIDHMSNGQISKSLNDEVLDITSLSAAWRQAIWKMTPITHMTFDLTLPKADDETNTFDKVYWDTGNPEEGGITVRTQDVMNLASTLATKTRMRASGDLWFNLVYDKNEGVMEGSMTTLKKQLIALAECKPSARGTDQGSV